MTNKTSNSIAQKIETLHRESCRLLDGASIALFRISFGLILLWEAVRYIYSGGIRDFYLTPQFHFTYYGLTWIKPWNGEGMYLHFIGIGIAAALVTIGIWYRFSMCMLALAFTYALLLEKSAYLNHIYLICLTATLMAFIPAEKVWSWNSQRGSRSSLNTIPAWCLWSLRTQIAIPYIFGGIVKLNSDWLHGAPLQLWMSQMTGIRNVFPFFGERWFAIAFSIAGLLIDLLIIPLLLWKPTRKFAFAVALAFHLLNASMFHIGIFPWFMICATTLFLPPEWPRQFLGNSHSKLESNATSSAGAYAKTGPVLMAGLVVWFVIQVAVPLRHFLYPGDVDWTEEGGRFAWRMMLHDKWAALGLTVIDQDTGRRFPFDPRRYLSRRQIDKMSYDPEMLRVFAHFIASELADAGYRNVEVHADVLCSLNGRRPQRLIDPKVNLAAEPARWTHQPWILPLTEPLPTTPWVPPPELRGPQNHN